MKAPLVRILLPFHALAIAAIPSPVSASTPPIQLGLEGDSTVIAVRVQPSVLGYVTLIHADGSRTAVLDRDVRWIRDLEGSDWTERVLEKRKSVGEAPVRVLYRVERRSIPSLRGRPKPLRDGFPILQTSVLARLDVGTERGGESRGYLGVDVGGMRNLDSRSALGATAHFGSDGDRHQLGLKARVRAWMGERLSIDVAPGFLLAGDRDRSDVSRFSGVTGEVSASWGDWISVIGQVERVSYEYRPHGYYFYNYSPSPTRRVSEVSVHVGGKFGGELGLAGMILTLLALGVVWGGTDVVY